MYNDYEDEYEFEPREDYEEQIKEIIENVVSKKCEEIIGRNSVLSNSLSTKEQLIQDLKKENRELKKKLEKFEGYDLFINMFNKDNIQNLVNNLGLPKTNPENYYEGMDSESISVPLKLIITYYDNKDVIIKLFELIGIENVNELKKFILPRDYDKSLIKEIINNLNTRIITTNSCYFGGNFGFWLEYKRDLSVGNLSKLIPLQEVFKSKYIPELFDDIIKNLQNHGNSKLLKVTDYHTFTNEQILQLANFINIKESNRMYEIEKDFIKKHSKILFNNDEFCEKCFEFISENQYNVYSIYDFNKKYQIQYLKTLKFDEAMYIINRMKYKDEIKKEIIKEICK